jgi:hypothetical protein
LARKFTVGRQGEQLLNDEFYKLFMSLKYLNYDRYKYIGDGSEEDYGDVQVERVGRNAIIPDHALRLMSRQGIDLISVYEGQQWNPVFEGFYHPANTKINGDGLVNYQLGIDSKTGALKYWDGYDWIIVKAADYEGDVNYFNGMNFQYIYPLNNMNNKPRSLDSTCPVPYVPYGRLFSDKKFIQRNT